VLVREYRPEERQYSDDRIVLKEQRFACPMTDPKPKKEIRESQVELKASRLIAKEGAL
jgi:hypothetical protein